MNRRTQRTLAAAVAAAALFIASECATDGDFSTGNVVAVGDGDSLTVLLEGEEVRIRLSKVDAPELAQPWGPEAKRALSKLVAGQTVRLEVVDIDRYERKVSDVYAGDLYVNRRLVRDGNAWAFTRFDPARDLVALEKEARAAERGLWSLPKRDRIPPWDWRRNNPRR